MFPFEKTGESSDRVNTNLGNVFTISYDLKTKKGIQFWRWYIKLENNLRIKGTIESGWNKTEKTLKRPSQTPEVEREKEIIHFKIRPEVNYSFTRKIDAMLYAQYRQETEFITDPNETTHEIEVRTELTMRF